MNLEPMQKATMSIKAPPYAQRLNRRVVVVKYGGNAMVDEGLKKKVMQDVALLRLVGFKPTIAHGGGKETSRWVGRARMETQFKSGLRVTDESTVEIAGMVLSKANKSLVQLASRLGINAVGIGDESSVMFKCRKKYAGRGDIGFVGDVEEMNLRIIHDLLEKDFLPIICPIGFDEDLLSYNISADNAACAITTVMEVEKFALLTDVEGVYKDHEDKSPPISEMTMEEAQNFVDSGVLGDGVFPKLQDYINAIKNGVSRVYTLDGRIPHRLLLGIFTDKSIGTATYDSEEDERYYHS